VEDEGRRLRRSSCELEGEEGEGEEGAYAGGSMIVAVAIFFPLFFLSMLLCVDERVWLRGQVRVGWLRGRMHDGIYMRVG
jgi:hypothetical protein